MSTTTDVFSDSSVVYNASPTVSAFMEDTNFHRFILGPVGSGKTTGVMFEVLRRCSEQIPGPDGIRRTRWAIVRNTLSQIKQTVLRDIETWLRPIVRLRVADNIVIIESGDVYAELFMIPLDDPEDKKRLLSMQLTGIWINEFIEVDPALLADMAGRCGRYPSAAQGGASWFGIIGDSNMPNVGSEWHRLLVLDRPGDWGVFVQPSGLAQNAENLNFLVQTPETLRLPLDHPDRIAQGRKYYDRLKMRAKSWVQRYVLAEYGDDPDGTAVFRETFSRQFHVVTGKMIGHNGGPPMEDTEEGVSLPAPPEVEGGITPDKGMPLIVGQDFGRNPCAVICQMDHRGRFLVLEEIVSLGMGLETHLTHRLRPKLAEERYRDLPVLVVGDPSGVAKSNLSEESCFDLLDRFGLPNQPAPTNAIDPRLRAVESLLLQQIGGKAMFLLDEIRCPSLLKAMMGLYRFGKMANGQTRPLPDKTNPWSDLADALQYACLAASPNFQTVVARTIHRATRPLGSRAPRKRISSRAWT